MVGYNYSIPSLFLRCELSIAKPRVYKNRSFHGTLSVLAARHSRSRYHANAGIDSYNSDAAGLCVITGSHLVMASVSYIKLLPVCIILD